MWKSDITKIFFCSYPQKLERKKNISENEKAKAIELSIQSGVLCKYTGYVGVSEQKLFHHVDETARCYYQQDRCYCFSGGGGFSFTNLFSNQTEKMKYEERKRLEEMKIREYEERQEMKRREMKRKEMKRKEYEIRYRYEEMKRREFDERQRQKEMKRREFEERQRQEKMKRREFEERQRHEKMKRREFYERQKQDEIKRREIFEKQRNESYQCEKIVPVTVYNEEKQKSDSSEKTQDKIEKAKELLSPKSNYELITLTRHQKAGGYWDDLNVVQEITGIKEDQIDEIKLDDKNIEKYCIATILAIAAMRVKSPGDKNSWLMIEQKALDWLKKTLPEVNIDLIISRIESLI